MSAKYDVIVFGATGFTGRLAAIKLSREAGLKLAIAGRNRSKLEEVARLCSQRPEILVADARDQESVQAMVREGRVIASFAGPFALYGEPVIAACAELGRAYCDISGESPFIREMIDRYQAQAKASGACLIPMSGFDSVPADLLAYTARSEGERHGWRLNKLTQYYHLSGGFNGGTLESALTLAEQKKTRLLQDSNLLIPDPSWLRGPAPSLMPSYEPLLRKWSAFFLMNFVNRAVVRRSFYLKNPEDPSLGAIDYSERILLGRGRAGQLQAYGVSGMLGLIGALTTQRIGRALLRSIGPAAGEGPSESSRQAGFCRGTLIARDDERARVMIKMKAKGDPGNEFTALSAALTALLLAQGKAGMTGFSTPSMALGETLIQALEARGVVFSTDYL